jgi:hypothetical protein
MKYKHAEAGGMSFSVILGGTDSWISAPSRLKSKSGKAAPVHFLLDLYGKSMTRRRRRLTEALKKILILLLTLGPQSGALWKKRERKGVCYGQKRQVRK